MVVSLGILAGPAASLLLLFSLPFERAISKDHPQRPWSPNYVLQNIPRAEVVGYNNYFTEYSSNYMSTLPNM